MAISSGALEGGAAWGPRERGGEDRKVGMRTAGVRGARQEWGPAGMERSPLGRAGERRVRGMGTGCGCEKEERMG